jgi:predicted RND superfamily exporter protein
MEFGLIAGLNVLLTYVISLILIPIVFSYLPPPSSKQIKHLDSKVMNKILDRIDQWVHFYRPRIYTIVVVLILISVYGMTRITTVGYVVDDLPKKDVIYRDLKFLSIIFMVYCLLKSPSIRKSRVARWNFPPYTKLTGCRKSFPITPNSQSLCQ